MKKLRVLLADDHSLVLDGIRRLLEGHCDLIGSASDGRALVEATRRLAPDAVVLDVSMPILNGIDAAREIKRMFPTIKLVFLSMYSNAIYLRKALEAGGSAYVLKSGASEELLTALKAAMKGVSYVSPGFGHDVIASLQRRPEKAARAPLELTSRQRQILQLIAEGKQNKEIAEILGVSVKTVEFHRSRLMTKLGAHTVAELTRFAIHEGIVAARE